MCNSYQLRLEVATADVIKASRHPRLWLVGVENYLLPGSTQPDSDSGADLVHPYLRPREPHRQRGGQTPDSAADDQDTHRSHRNLL